MKKKDYLPGAQETFNDWQDNFMGIVVLNAVLWVIPAGAITILQGLQATYQPLYNVANKSKKSSRTTKQNNDRKAATSAYKKGIRKFVKQYLVVNDKISNSDRGNLGITVPDTTRTPSGTPKSVPDIFTEPLKSLRVKVTARQQPDANGRSVRRAPDDAREMEVAVHVGDNPPADGDGCVTKVRSKRTTITIKFTTADANKVASVWVRWIGFKGQLGNWGGPEEETIPK